MAPETAFRWDKNRVAAAQHVADDKLTDVQIATRLRIGKTTLERWKRHPAFMARVAEIVEEYRDRLLHEGIADKARRMQAYNDEFDRIEKLIAKRARVYGTVVEVSGREIEAIGGETGLMVHDVKDGRDVFQADVGLLRERRGVLEQAAREAGDWTERRDLTSGGQTIKDLLGALAVETPPAEELDPPEIEDEAEFEGA